MNESGIKQVMQDALNTLSNIDTIVFEDSESVIIGHIDNSICNLRQAIKDLDEQEPVATVRNDFPSRIAWISEPPDFADLYTHPSPIKELSDRCILKVAEDNNIKSDEFGWWAIDRVELKHFARAILKAGREL